MGFALLAVVHKYLLSILFLQALLLGPMLPSAWGEDHSEPVILEEESNPEVQEAMAEVAVAIAEKEHENIIIRTKRGAEFEFSLEPQNETQFQIYQLLDDEQEVRFQENRIWALRKAATILDKAELAVGFGKLMGEKFVQILGWYPNPNNPMEHLAELSMPPRQKNSVSMRQRGIIVVEKLLRGFDRFLWSNAPIVTEQNEFTMAFSGHAFLIGDYKGKTKGGILGLGVNFAFNRQEKVTVFEIFGIAEKAKSLETRMRIFGLSLLPGVETRIGLGLKSNRNVTDITAARKGQITYPLIYPVYYFNSEDEASVGWQPPLSFPPIYNNAFRYKTKAIDKSLVRLTFSKHQKGFFRLYLGLPTKMKDFCDRLFSSQN